MTSARAQRTVGIVGVDFLSRASASAVAAAQGLLAFAPGPEMHLLSVLSVPAGPSGPIEYGGSTESRALLNIERELAALDDLGNRATVGTEIRVFSHVRIGDEAREIGDLAQNLAADFIVLGPHEPDSPRRLFHGPDSVPREVIRSANCPVFVVEWAILRRPTSAARPASSLEPAPRHPGR